MGDATLSKVGIFNLALIKLDITIFLTDPDEDVHDAKVLSQAWEEALHTVLELGEWRCARKRASLARLEDPPVWGYSYEYQLPVDCVKPIETNMGETYAWEIEDEKILTDYGGDADEKIYITYIYYLDTPTKFSPLLADAIATRLAHMTCTALTGDKAKKAAIGQDFAAILVLAQAEDKRWGKGPDSASPVITDL